MKYSRTQYFVILAFTLVDCGYNYQVSKNGNQSRVIVEGIVVTYFPTGGTREGSYHGGYIIKDPNWIISPSDLNLMIFLEHSPNIYTFNKKKVHVEGSFIKVPEHKIDALNFVHAYNAIIVDTIYVIE